MIMKFRYSHDAPADASVAFTKLNRAGYSVNGILFNVFIMKFMSLPIFPNSK